MSSPFSNPIARAPEQAQAYVRSILDLLGDRDPLEVLPQLAARIRETIAGVLPEDLRVPEAPGKWSMHETIAHLADAEVAFGWRLRVVIAQDQPPILPFDQDAWTATLAGAYPDTKSAIDQVEVMRRAHVALLTSLSPAQWQRAGLHAERGPESVRRMAELYAGHDLVHLRQLARIRKAIQR